MCRAAKNSHVVNDWGPVSLSEAAAVPTDYCIVQGGDQKVAELVGVSQAYLLKLVQSGQRRHVSESDAEKERICKRFFMALMLNDVIQEVTSIAIN